jgi:hypothetical protein
MNKIKFKFDPLNTKGEFYARNPETDDILGIVTPDKSGNFNSFDFKNLNLKKIEIWFWDPYNLVDKRITTIFAPINKKL